jgi:hypothetical protein
VSPPDRRYVEPPRVDALPLAEPVAEPVLPDPVALPVALPVVLPPVVLPAPVPLVPVPDDEPELLPMLAFVRMNCALLLLPVRDVVSPAAPVEPVEPVEPVAEPVEPAPVEPAPVEPAPVEPAPVVEPVPPAMLPADCRQPVTVTVRACWLPLADVCPLVDPWPPAEPVDPDCAATPTAMVAASIVPKTNCLFIETSVGGFRQAKPCRFL